MITDETRHIALSFVDVSADIQNKINLVQDNARDEKKRIGLDEATRQLFYA
ncbi:hypothetical protein KK062_21060 [Fulvivirgaceae bacterium PWU5]|uniref:Uncharacterized protein n=1 Tax=Dawidia cretensis TaxID=2782350 RepID=A0AAP2GRX6_9BACT|nr:hypothetical protein [Dawidia cretensis]MBT1710744.1 hypothetical protein [Dawidia cretensis]